MTSRPRNGTGLRPCGYVSHKTLYKFQTVKFMDTATKLLFKGSKFGQITLALFSNNNHDVSVTLRKGPI